MMNIKTILILIFLQIKFHVHSIPIYFCTAANKEYYNHLINLIGSIHKDNYNDLSEIAVFDLGLTQEQKNNLSKISKIKIYHLEITHPDILKPFHTGYKFVPGWYAWKLVAIKQSAQMFPYVLWIDAGSTVLTSLQKLFEYINFKGYFLCTIGSGRPDIYNVEWGTTNYVKDKFNLENKPWFKTKESAMGGILGVSKKVFSDFVLPLYELTKDLRNFADDGTAPNGFGCGRHDQTLISIFGYSLNYDIHIQDSNQITPMILSTFGKQIPFYITWDKTKVNQNTNIFSSRNNLNLEYYKNFIKYK